MLLTSVPYDADLWLHLCFCDKLPCYVCVNSRIIIILLIRSFNWCMRSQTRDPFKNEFWTGKSFACFAKFKRICGLSV